MFYYEVHVCQGLHDGFGVPVKSEKELDDNEAILLAMSTGEVDKHDVVDYIEPLSKEEYYEVFYYDGRYMSINDFIAQQNLEVEAGKVFGEGWEAENDIEQIQELLNSIDDRYVVKAIEEKTARDSRADDYIEVFKIK